MAAFEHQRVAPGTAAAVPVTVLRGVGPKIAGRLARLGIQTLQDVLFHLPLRYEDRTRVVAIASLRPGMRAVVQGRVELTDVVFGRRRSLVSRISDGSGALDLRFFHFSRAQQQALARGVLLRCYGEARPGRVGLEMVHPEYAGVDPAAPLEAHLTPVYPTTEGLHQIKLRDLTAQALQWLARNPAQLPELLPAAVLQHCVLPRLDEALQLVHRPPPEAALSRLEAGTHPAQRRLAFEELLAHHLSLRQLRLRLHRLRAPALSSPGALRERFLRALPFALTDAQRRVADELYADLARDRPMLRLVQGDVGSGKTVVAALAALAAVEAGYQCALMAPTELLAEQHLRNFERWLGPLDVPLAWLSGRAKGRARDRVLARIADGAAAVAIGTHALFQDDVAFERLGLIIVDEQHRFGVHQRLALREKGARGGRAPHQLIMTATPIPRTLAMAVYADLDTSLIDELPPGRTPVRTVVVPASRRPEVVQRVSEACRSGRQAYWVCTLIDESEALQAQAAADSAQQLAAALPDLRIGLVHGRLKPAEKEAVMGLFEAAELDVLVATTVIEVGVDVPNATLMIIENAERLGLAQLHQLRGRVGRGTAESGCVLMYQAPLSRAARTRLAALRETTDGFEIARRDLELRGPGEVLGTRQTGMLQLRTADLVRDRDLLDDVQRAADALLDGHGEQVGALIARWMGRAVEYGGV